MTALLAWFGGLVITYGFIPVDLTLTAIVLIAWLAFWAAVDAINRRQTRRARDWRTDLLEHTTAPARKEKP
ncbi:hypothetical protein [Streptomyces sp. SID10815]|uniref:hypothetical protein n=1 Tax=Streptomyces sp. SID10815 TaxID=2706027 RepID=UPI0013C8A1AE|nr:hypothetical protein [Streptomyces sp. SID10815]NEA52358.1 hypothetical protein [Streptomyces sp. SID10815]